jgi:putative transport protein
MQNILEFLGQNPVVPLFVILGLGLLVGKIRIAGVEIGGVTGVLFLGLAFGHYGFRLPPASVNLGFILFIFCVGVQAGPQFVAAFKRDGVKYALLALITAITATAVAGVLARLFRFPFGMDAGALAGALTSTPTLVAAQDAVRAGLKDTGGLTSEQVLSNL